MVHRYEILSKLINENKYKVIAEVGVNRGINAIELIQRCPDLTCFYLIDHDRNKVFTYDTVFRKYIKAKFIRLESKQAVKCIEDGELDLVFIDACHEYESVKEDINLWYSKVKRGGIISGHDYNEVNTPGVVKATKELFKKINREFHFEGDVNQIWWVKK